MKSIPKQPDWLVGFDPHRVAKYLHSYWLTIYAIPLLVGRAGITRKV